MPFHRLLTFGEKIKGTDPTHEEKFPESNSAPSEPSVSSDEAAASSAEKTAENDMDGSFHEKDNRAVRIQRLNQAADFWTEYEKSRPNIPFLRYIFDTQLQAEEALLSVSCIHQAEDTGHLICTEPIIMGCYRTIDGRYEVFLAGDQLTYKTWSEGTEKFSRLGGQYRNQLRPETYERFKSQSKADQVVLQKEYYEISLTETKYYQIFEASSFVAAKNFLLRLDNVITRPNHFIQVVTPKGMLFRDIDRIHEPG